MTAALRRTARTAGRRPIRALRDLWQRRHTAAPQVTEERALPPDFDDADIETFRAVQAFTMTPPERVWALRNAVKYVVGLDLPGAMVECGVWRGGSVMTVARTLLELGRTDYDLYLFDTFEGMSPPTERDVTYTGGAASAMLAQQDRQSRVWGYAALEDVHAAVSSVGYPGDRIHFVKGRVEDTLPAHAPERISLLRLDTDWYESTRHELIHLFPRLVPGGVLIVDDYGHWRGAREAVDEYFHKAGVPLLLNRIDYTARIGVKL
jgi:O-methyltransferase